MEKLIINCIDKKITKRNRSDEELEQRALDEQQRQEEELLNSLKPSEKEIKRAEIALVSIELLMEVGLI